MSISPEKPNGLDPEKNQSFGFFSEQMNQIRSIKEPRLVERGKYDKTEEILEKIEQTCADNSEILMQLPADLRRHLDREIYLIREKIGEYKELDLPEGERTRKRAEKETKTRESERKLAENLEKRRSELVDKETEKHEESLRKAREEAKEAFGEGGEKE